MHHWWIAKGQKLISWNTEKKVQNKFHSTKDVRRVFGNSNVWYKLQSSGSAYRPSKMRAPKWHAASSISYRIPISYFISKHTHQYSKYVNAILCGRTKHEIGTRYQKEDPDLHTPMIHAHVQMYEITILFSIPMECHYSQVS